MVKSKLKTSIAVTAVIAASVTIFSGCSSKHMVEQQKKFSQKELNVISNYNNKSTIADSIKSTEIDENKEFIDLSAGKKVANILNELGSLNKRAYMLDKNSLNVDVPITNSSAIIKIKTITDFKKYLEDTTNYTLEIITNKYLKNSIKIIRIYDKKALKSNFSKMPFSISGKTSVSDALLVLSKSSGFSIIHKDDLNSSLDINDTSNVQNTSNVPFSEKNVFFNGNNVSNFLNYIEKNFDVYTSIDYYNKTITLGKYQTKTFDVYALNVNYELQDSADVGGDEESSVDTTTSPVTATSEIDGVKNFEENLRQILKEDSRSKLFFDKSSGQVVVRATNANMKEIEEIITDYNANYSKQVKIVIDVYEFVVNKDFSFGTDFSIVGDKFNGATSSLTDIVLNIGKTEKGNDLDYKFGSDNELIRYAKNTKYEQQYTNNIPNLISILNQRDYIKSISSTTTSNTTTTTSTNMEIASLNNGVVITVLPRIIGDEIVVKSEIKVSDINSLTSQSDAAGNTVYMPDQDSKTIPSYIILKNKTKKVIGSYQNYQNVKNYKGVAPIEDFIIGGNSGQKFVKKEIIYVLSAQLVD